MKLKVFIFSSYFKPGFKAGGPIQSIYNIIRVFGSRYEMFIYALDHDIDYKKGETYNVKKKVWIDFEGLGKAFYVGRFEYYLFQMFELVKIKPSVIYFNSFFSLHTILGIYPAYAYALLFKCKIVIAPRGELEDGALQINSIKKKLYLNIFRILFSRIVYWHATSFREAISLNELIRSNKILRADNFSILNIKYKLLRKEVNELKIIYLSRITPKKNLLYAIQCLKNINQRLNLEFTIAGPREDLEYWELCLNEIKSLPKNINVCVMESVEPNRVQLILQQHHLLFFPTKSENYGHIIYESLSCGIPVLISNQTPWQSTERNGIFSYDLSVMEKFSRTIEMFYCMDECNYNKYSLQANMSAMESQDLTQIHLQYERLFQ